MSTLVQRVVRTVKDGPAENISLSAGTALTVLNHVGGYAAVGVAGIIMARALGAHDRGVYSLVTTIALLFGAFAELGISKAGIYFVGQKRFNLQEVLSNNLAWFTFVGSLWFGACLLAAYVQPGFLPGELGTPELIVIGLGGASVLFLVMAQDLLLMTGSVVGYNVILGTEPLMRAILVIFVITVLGLGIVGVLSMWLLAIFLAAIPALWMLMNRAHPVPRVDFKILKTQLSYGVRTSFGYLLETANHRLDVLLVAGIAGTTALGQYAVAYGIAELLWRIPFGLGAVFFPKVAALDPEANAETAATTCRRALFLIFLATLIVMPFGRVLIGSLYGEEFLPGVTSFYILAPSALVYTVFRVLNSSLAARGLPETGIFAGAASLPITIGLGFLLIPRLGIEGAAIASMAAYSTAAIVALVRFTAVTGKSVRETLIINGDDLASSVATARTLLARSEAA